MNKNMKNIIGTLLGVSLFVLSAGCGGTIEETNKTDVIAEETYFDTSEVVETSLNTALETEQGLLGTEENVEVEETSLETEEESSIEIEMQEETMEETSLEETTYIEIETSPIESQECECNCECCKSCEKCSLKKENEVDLVFETDAITETETSYEDNIALKKSIEEIAIEVWEGKWGNGEERKSKLISAGYDYNEVQAEVNKRVVASSIVEEEIEPQYIASSIAFEKTFSRGTYYAYGKPCKGGSGRQLIDCSIGNEEVKGSIASSYLYNNYGYNYCGKRTKVYLEVEGYSEMDGYYYLDDSDAGNPEVIDFFYISGNNCPFQRQGVVKVDCYILDY